MFTMDSFGDILPLNWEEIADYLNELADLYDATTNVSRHDFENALWEDYCNGKLSGAPKPQWKYTVELRFFVTGQGYSYSEDFDEGTTDHFFTAKEWNDSLDDPIETDTGDGWINIVVRFYDVNDQVVSFTQVNKTLW